MPSRIVFAEIKLNSRLIYPQSHNLSAGRYSSLPLGLTHFGIIVSVPKLVVSSDNAATQSSRAIVVPGGMFWRRPNIR